jgi:hypothetical protein
MKKTSKLPFPTPCITFSRFKTVKMHSPVFFTALSLSEINQELEKAFEFKVLVMRYNVDDTWTLNGASEHFGSSLKIS